LTKNPNFRKTKRYGNPVAVKFFTIDDARDIVLKVKKLEGLSPNTIENYEKVFNDFDRFFGEKTDVASLTRDDARNFIYWELNDKVQWLKSKSHKDKKKGVSVGTVNTYLNYAKAAFSILVNEEIVDDNIFDSTSPIKEKQKPIETLPIEDINKLLRSLDKSWYSEFRMYVLINTCLDSFGRITEILSLKKSDIDFEKQAVTFNQTKSGKIRIVPISSKVCKLLQELIEENDEVFETDYIFLSTLGNPLKPDTARKHLRIITERIGIDNLTGFHIFRHTASEMFLRQNGSMRVLQKILGHSEITTTSIYAHVLDDTIKQQHEQFSPLNLIDEKGNKKTRRGKLK
jgi:integrase/recombinase XerD